MSASEIDDYLAELAEPKRSTLEEVRRRILEVIPDAHQTISYQYPAFRVGGKVVAGFAAFTNHLSYLPHSGSVLAEIPDAAAYGGTKSALHFPVDEPLPRELIKQLLDIRLRQAAVRP